jgi:hypothetical protein
MQAAEDVSSKEGPGILLAELDIEKSHPINVTVNLQPESAGTEQISRCRH